MCHTASVRLWGFQQSCRGMFQIIVGIVIIRYICISEIRYQTYVINRIFVVPNGISDSRSSNRLSRTDWAWGGINPKKTFLTLTGISNLLITIVLFAGAASIIPVSLDLVGDVIISISGGSALLQLILIFGGFGILAVGTVVLHEHAHRVVMEYFDYSVEIHYGIPLSYALIEEQMIQRNHNILSLISPLISFLHSL